MTGLEIAYGLALGGSFIYHRWIKDKPKPVAEDEFALPITDEGAPVPLIFGRVRVRSPILIHTSDYYVANTTSWGFAGVAKENDGVGGDVVYPLLYGADMLFALGIPFGPVGEVHSTNRLHAVYGGETEMFDAVISGYTTPIGDLTGDGGHEMPAQITSPQDGLAQGCGLVEFLNGNPAQQLVDPTYPHASTTFAGDRLSDSAGGVTNAAAFPGYRGLALAFLFSGRPWGNYAFDAGIPAGTPSGSDPPRLTWLVGPRPQPPAYSFEVSSYPAAQLYTSGIVVRVGDDANPVDVIADLLTGSYGKLGLSTNLIDQWSFRKAGETLLSEGHGYSRVIDQPMSAADIIGEILEQIDGVLYDDPATGLLGIKLIRPDFDPNFIPKITPANCVRIENFTMRGLSDLPNKVRLMYTSRADLYVERSASAQNQANAVGQDGRAHEVTLRMPGITTAALAEAVAGRELGVMSLPLKTCRAIVDRSFWNVFPGSAVSVRWPAFHLSNVVFRVADVDRGGHDSNTIALDLIEDHFYVHRGKVLGLPPVAPFPTTAVAE